MTSLKEVPMADLLSLIEIDTTPIEMNTQEDPIAWRSMCNPRKTNLTLALGTSTSAPASSTLALASATSAPANTIPARVCATSAPVAWMSMCNPKVLQHVSVAVPR